MSTAPPPKQPPPSLPPLTTEQRECLSNACDILQAARRRLPSTRTAQATRNR